jgi:two-component system response regulator CiaR
MKILVVEDDDMLREAVVSILAEENYDVAEADTGDEGLYAAEQGLYDLIILDIMLPGMDGLDIVKRLRSHKQFTPILLLTARDSVADRVKGLDSGADDYLVKPFAVPELVARVKALLRRRVAAGSDEGLSLCGIRLDSKRKDGFVGEQSLSLTAKEYELLEFFLINHGQILTREQIFDRIWGFESETTLGIVDVYVHYLRKKLAPFQLDALIKTVRGAGFMLEDK